MSARRRTALAAAGLLAGCAIPPLPVPPASVALVNRIDAARLPPLAVGIFAPAPNLPAGADRGLGVRASQIRPENGSFAGYLGETLKAELQAAGKLDPAASLSIGGTLVENGVSSGVGKGHARVAAEFVVTRRGREIWRKTLHAERQWDSSFIGAVAIMNADQGYGALYTDLAGALIDDPGFQAAVKDG